MKIIGASLVLAVALATAGAQTNTNTTTLSLQDCIADALKRNLDVQVARYQPQISLYNLDAAYAGYEPEFSLSGYRDHNRSGGYYPNGAPVRDENTFQSALRGGTPWGMTYGLVAAAGEEVFYSSTYGRVGVDVRQPLLKNFLVDGTRLNISIAKNRVKFSEQLLRQQIMATVTAVEDAYYELIYARENLKVRQEALNLANVQLEQDKQRLQVGSIAERGGTLEQDEANVAQARANLIDAELLLSTSRNTLRNLITDSYALSHGVDIASSTPLDSARQSLSLQDSWSKGMTQRPDLIQAKLDLEQQGIHLKYLRNQVWPQLDLVGSLGYNGAAREYPGTFSQVADASRPYYRYGAELSIPLGNASARSSLKSGKAAEQQLLLRLKQLEQNIIVQIDNSVKQTQSAWERMNATRQSSVYALAALDAEQKKYSAGKSTTFTVLQLQNALTAARSQEIRALVDYNKALANLALQEGATLERHKIDVTVR